MHNKAKGDLHGIYEAESRESAEKVFDRFIVKYGVKYERLLSRACAGPHVRCCARYLFISNMVTFFLPNTASSLASARISRRFLGFCSSCCLM